MQEFKHLGDLHKRDPTVALFGYVDPTTGEHRPLEIRDFHNRVSKIVLGTHVPDEVQSYFNTAKNLLVYSYYHYGFVPVAAFLAASTVEMAVRTIYPSKPDPDHPKKRPPSFHALLERAVKEGRIREAEFTSLPAAKERQRRIMQDYAAASGLKLKKEQKASEEQFLVSITGIRNTFAHPELAHTLITPEMAFGLMQRTGEAIDQLFTACT